MEAFGVPRQVVAFVLPTGYSFNLDEARFISHWRAFLWLRRRASI